MDGIRVRFPALPVFFGIFSEEKPRFRTRENPGFGLIGLT